MDLPEEESVRHGVAHGDPRPAPSSYDETYTPPEHFEKLLESKNPHERDSRIRFLALPHIYLVDDEPCEISVTSVVAAFSDSFDPVKTVTKMVASRYEAWPRYKYALNAKPLPGPAEGNVLLVSGETDKTLWAGMAPPNVSEDWAFQRARAKERGVLTLKWFAFERAMTVDEIKSMWERDGMEAANRGTECHYLMEEWSNSMPTRDCPEVKNGIAFLKTLAPLGVKAFRTEWEVFTGHVEGIAGSIDWVGQFPDGSLILVDWKRTRENKHVLHTMYKKYMTPPLDHLDDLDMCKYTLQLSTYAWILEKKYGFVVKALALASLHPEHAFHTYVPFLEKEVEFLMAKRRERVAMKFRAEFEFEDLPRCSLSGNVAWEPVRVNGALCDAKQAAWRLPDADREPDEEAKTRIQAVEAHIKPIGICTEELCLANAQAWQIRIPKDGYPNFTPCRDV